MHTYLLINILTVFFPVVLSFERRVHFVRQWSRVLAAAVIVGIPFAWWDAVFTARGVWGFNREYLIGVSFFGLPAEEILFFICIPFACLFIYELVLYAQKRDIVAPFVKYLVPGMAACLLAVGLANYDKIYTAVTFIALAVVLGAHRYMLRSGYLGYFFQAYAISLIPFLIVNGVLTNGIARISSEPVVWYNNAENLSLRIIGIPVEDFFYSMLLLLLNVTVYEYLKRR